MQPEESRRRPMCTTGSEASGLKKVADQLSEGEEEGRFLMEQLQRVQTMEEIGAVGREECVGVETVQRAPLPQEQQHPVTTTPRKKKEKKKKSSLINLNNVLSAPSCTIKTPMLPMAVEVEEEEEEDQRLIIKEAFAGDDVIEDFLKEKRSSEQAGKPKDVDLTLPGWGAWGGTGLKPSAKKRKRFLIKAAPGPPRKDHKLPNVIINEKRDLMATAHQVNELPFPFASCQQFESSVRAPIGATWNTQRAFQQLTAPRIITRPGHIIAPISKEDVFRSAQQAKPAHELNPRKQLAPRARRQDAQQRETGRAVL
ncbi:U3 small nucleolar RNA-associated protein 14 homolog A-like [Rhinatrema bivittatum]|uniref:U3 small nucleolar RNA-associated protein 14 homolog A-like n=1 Tax=Rhinatrema bivittatum TaxID=194408 RepID=UPI00112AE29B|nr:U3 small nucleolar RNA-associated protein 14 homolog A-like [Rhinatrema bivittatum]